MQFTIATMALFLNRLLTQGWNNHKRKFSKIYYPYLNFKQFQKFKDSAATRLAL